MCHIVLLLPLLALPVFWVLPLTLALQIYGAVLAVSIATYWYIALAMRRPVQTGAEGMVNAKGKVVEIRTNDLLVEVRNELWHATSTSSLHEGDRIKVVAVDESMLQVQGSDSGTAHSGKTLQPPPQTQCRIHSLGKGRQMLVAHGK